MSMYAETCTAVASAIHVTQIIVVYVILGGSPCDVVGRWRGMRHHI